MKRSIAWHRECLENQRRHYAGLLEQIERLKMDYARSQRDINAYDAQIIKAELKRLTEFDRERFGKTKQQSAALGESKEGK